MPGHEIATAALFQQAMSIYCFYSVVNMKVCSSVNFLCVPAALIFLKNICIGTIMHPLTNRRDYILVSTMNVGTSGQAANLPHHAFHYCGQSMELNNDKLIVLIVFCLVYIFLVFSRRYRGRAVWCGIICLMAAGVLGLSEIVYAINWNVIGIFAGTLIVAELFIYSRVPALLSDLLIDKSKTVGWAILLVCALSGLVSAFVENVATVLIVAPIALELARRLKVSPKPFLIGIAISSNLQGTATLIGDPPSMILAAHEKMTFNDFFIFHMKPSIFFATQAGAVLAFVVLYLFFRKYRQPVVQIEVEKAKSWVPTGLLVVMMFALAFSSNYDPDFRWLGGTECMVLGVFGLLWAVVRNRGQAVSVVKSYDWSTTIFLAGVFVLVETLTQVGIIDDVATWLGKMVGCNKFLAFSCIVWSSVLFSAFIDNVPYLTAMLPVVARLSATMGVENDYLLAFGLIIGCCLGGNITPIGASANIVSVGLLRKNGEHCGFLDFVKIGLPFTIAATAAGSAFVWFIWG